jgi:RNA polymerase-binding transcription factor DksA
MVHPSRPRLLGARVLLARQDTLASRLPELREALECQRDFRRAQLAELNNEFSAALPGNGGPYPCDPTASDTQSQPLRQVAQQVAAGAFCALSDIEWALTKMRTGNYGRCCACAGDIALAVLMAIPQTTLCLSCRRVIEGVEGCDGPGDIGHVDAPERSRGRRRGHRDAVTPSAAPPFGPRGRVRAAR